MEAAGGSNGAAAEGSSTVSSSSNQVGWPVACTLHATAALPWLGWHPCAVEKQGALLRAASSRSSSSISRTGTVWCCSTAVLNVG